MPKYKINEDELYFEIDLEKEMGGKISDPGARRLIAEDLIKKIVDRADENKGFDKSSNSIKDFKPSKYSNAYADSLEFKAWDKSKGDVNLKQTGSMLSSIDLLKDNSNTIRIGIDNEEAPKAHGHQTGQGTAPKRPFLGVTKEDIEEMKEKYADDIAAGLALTVKELLDESVFRATFRELKKRGVI